MGRNTIHMLDGNPVSSINADLTTVLDVNTAKPLSENRGLSFMGVTPAGPFDIPETGAGVD